MRPLLGCLLGVALSLSMGSCARSKLEPTRDRASQPATVVAASFERSTPSSSRSCDRRIHRLLAERRLTPDPDAERERLALLRSAQAEPVLFVRAPRDGSGACPAARAHARALRTSRQPGALLDRLLPALAADRQLARQVLLREGYLYAATPELGRALAERVEPQHLFAEPRIWIQRGQRLGWARPSSDGTYVWSDGPERGRRVRLMLFDRLGIGVPPEALHRDLRELRYRLHFDRARARHLSDTQIVLDLKYGEHWVPSLLSTAGAELDLVCDAPAESEASAIAESRMRASRHERALRAVRRSLLARIDTGRATLTRKAESELVDAGGSRPSWPDLEQALFAAQDRLHTLDDTWFERDRHAIDHRSGDIVVTERGASFVYEEDPMTGEPIAVIELGSRPEMQLWRGAPAASVRIRPTLEWLEASVPALEDPRLVPPPLGVGRARD